MEASQEPGLSEYERRVAACPEPQWHLTHMYCPACPWTAATCGVHHPSDKNIVCLRPPQHDTREHYAVVTW